MVPESGLKHIYGELAAKLTQVWEVRGKPSTAKETIIGELALYIPRIADRLRPDQGCCLTSIQSRGCLVPLTKTPLHGSRHVGGISSCFPCRPMQGSRIPKFEVRQSV